VQEMRRNLQLLDSTGERHDSPEIFVQSLQPVEARRIWDRSPS
jgi:hypothetical protein